MRRAMWGILVAFVMAFNPPNVALSADATTTPPGATWHTVPVQSTDPAVEQQQAAEALQHVQQIDGLNLQDFQYQNLMLGKNIALESFAGDKTLTPVAAHNFALLVMSIMWQETRAGMYGPVGDMDNPFGERSYGFMQVKLRTAKKMLHDHPQLESTYFQPGYADEEVIAALIYNHEFNVKVACAYLNYLHYEKKLSWDKVITAYNRGYDGAKKIHFKPRSYTKSVNKNIKDKGMNKLASGG